MYYDRHIKYFDHIKDGVRLRGAGFLKVEIRDENCNLSLQISGLQSVDTYTLQVYGLWGNGEEMLGNISLQGGRGSKELQFARSGEKPNDAGDLVYEGLMGIRIPMGDGSELYCRIRDTEDASTRTEVEEVSVVGKIPEEQWSIGSAEEEISVTQKMPEETASVRIAAEEMHDVQKEPGESMAGGNTVEEVSEESLVTEMTIAEQTVTSVSEVQRELAEAERESPEKDPSPQSRRMMEEKWEQLWAVYPHFAPFGDEREYLRIGLGDFVILRERFYRLVHNSFLLHGFYNYQHLILTRLRRRGEIFYYIGVPGNFYDREKQVALMYGFESFECAKEPAGQGDFGYYMIRVEV